MSLVRALLNTYQYFDPRLLPNRPGYKFVARLQDGRLIHCETYVREFSIRASVRSEEKADLKFDEIVDWREV